MKYRRRLTKRKRVRGGDGAPMAQPQPVAPTGQAPMAQAQPQPGVAAYGAQPGVAPTVQALPTTMAQPVAPTGQALPTTMAQPTGQAPLRTGGRRSRKNRSRRNKKNRRY
jgi:hypothetical protein